MERHVIGVFVCVGDGWRGCPDKTEVNREKFRRKGKWTNLRRLEEFPICVRPQLILLLLRVSLTLPLNLIQLNLIQQAYIEHRSASQEVGGPEPSGRAVRSSSSGYSESLAPEFCDMLGVLGKMSSYLMQ